MKIMYALAAVVLSSACTINNSPVRGDVPSYTPLPQPHYPVQTVETPKVTKPEIKIDSEVRRPNYRAGAGIGGMIAQEFFDSAKIVFERSDYEDIERAANTAINSRDVGKPVSWDNRRTGRSGQVNVIKSLNKDGRYCRQFENEVRMTGGSVIMDGFACKDPQSNWYLLDQ